jgi:Domain of unknown function (DUF4167)
VKRSRGRGRRPQGGHTGHTGGHSGGHHNHNRSFDSTGPDVKIRGTAASVYEKYLQLARDASSAGDRVTQENYLQHAEHYYRILMAQGGPVQQQQPQQPYPGQPQPNGNGNGNGDGQPMPAGYAQPPQPGSTPSFSLADAEEEEGEELT